MGNELIKDSILIFLVSLMLSACAANSAVPMGPTLVPSKEPAGRQTTHNIESTSVDQPGLSTAVVISFVNDVLPILKSRCIVCHGGERREFGLDLTSYSALIAGSDSGPIVVAGDADNSLIVNLVLAGRMPKRAPKLIPAQVQILIEWINQGALDN
jgi:hypothetical protein